MVVEPVCWLILNGSCSCVAGWDDSHTWLTYRRWYKWRPRATHSLSKQRTKKTNDPIWKLRASGAKLLPTNMRRIERVECEFQISSVGFWSTVVLAVSYNAITNHHCKYNISILIAFFSLLFFFYLFLLFCKRIVVVIHIEICHYVLCKREMLKLKKVSCNCGITRPYRW